MKKSIFHLVCCGLFALTCYQDHKLVKGNLLPIPDNFLSRFVWLTNVDLYSQTIYHFIGFLLATFSNRRHPIFDYLARVIIGPLGVAVTVLYWGLTFADPNSVNDEMGKKLLSMPWYNHRLHTLPSIVAHLDLFFWNHTRFSNFNVLKGIGVFVGLYVLNIHYVHYITGFWAYPILAELPGPYRMIFISACMIIIYLCQFWLSFVDKFINPIERKPKQN